MYRRCDWESFVTTMTSDGEVCNEYVRCVQSYSETHLTTRSGLEAEVNESEGSTSSITDYRL